MLTPEQSKKFNEEGWLVIPNFFTKEKANELIQESKRLVREMDLDNHPKTVFLAGAEKQTNDEYFLDSGDKVRFFFEEKSWKDGKLVVEKEQSINKIGHALHELNPIFEEFSFQNNVVEIVKDLGFETPALLQSMVIFKQPRIGGEVFMHQDSTFLYTEPISAVGFWFALEDCTLDNGCLYFLNGSHKEGVHNNRRFIRDGKGGVTFTAPARQYDEKEFIPALCPAGSLVLIHGSVVHMSKENLSDKSRLAYAFHIIEDPSGNKHKYPEDNWLQPSKDTPFSLVYQHKKK